MEPIVLISCEYFKSMDDHFLSRFSDKETELYETIIYLNTFFTSIRNFCYLTLAVIRT